jgi:hypothetical protein
MGWNGAVTPCKAGPDPRKGRRRIRTLTLTSHLANGLIVRDGIDLCASTTYLVGTRSWS